MLNCPLCNMRQCSSEPTLMVSRWFKGLIEQSAEFKFVEYNTQTGEFIRAYTNTKKRKADDASIDIDDSAAAQPGGSHDIPIVL